MLSRKQRRNNILDSLREVDRLSPREVILADKIIELEDALIELQDAYSELQNRVTHVSCAVIQPDNDPFSDPVPF